MKKSVKLLITVLCGLFLLLVGCSSSSDNLFTDEFLTDPDFNATDMTVIFEGNVLYDNNPVFNSKIKIYDSDNNLVKEMTTDENGKIYIYKKDIGVTFYKSEYTFEVINSGFNNIIEKIDLNYITKMEFNVEPLSNFIVNSDKSVKGGIVVDKYSLLPIEDVEIRYNDKLILSNEDGEFVIDTQNQTNVEFSKENYKTLDWKVYDSDYISSNNTVYLENLFSHIKGLILDASNMNALEEVSVSLYKQNKFISIVQSNDRGEYKFSNIIEGGEYTLKFEHEDFKTYEYKMVIDDSKEYIIESIDLIGKSSILRGQIVDINTERGITGVAVVTGNGNQCFTDSEGNYNISSIIPGYYTITIVAPGYETQEKNIYIPANEIIEEDFVIKEESGNSEINLKLYTHDDGNIVRLDPDLVTVKMYRYLNVPDDIEATDADKFEISVQANIKADTPDILTISNVYSGLYDIYMTAIISEENATVLRSVGIYEEAKEGVYISSNMTVNIEYVLPKAVDADESEDTTEVIITE